MCKDSYIEIIEKYSDKELSIGDYTIADEDYIKSMFDKIKNGEPLDLSYTYFDSFPLDVYREENNLQKTDRIIIKFDNAFGAIFNLKDHKADFSWVDFYAVDTDTGIAFNNAVFLDGEIDFSYCNFNGSDLSLERVKLINSKLSLVYCENIKDLMFTNILKEKSDIILYGIEDISGDVDFSNLNNFEMNLGSTPSGCIIINNCIFKNSVLKFENNNLSNTKDNILFIDDKFDIKNTEFFASKFNSIVFYECSFDSKVSFKDCEFNYFILQNCILRDSFKIMYYEIPEKQDTKFCFLGTVFNGYFDMDNTISSKILKRQKKFVVNEYIAIDEPDKFYLDDTSYLEKSIQTNNLSEIFSALGKSKEQDKTYALFKRYKNIYRVQEQWYCLKSIKLLKDLNTFKKIAYYIKHLFLLIISSLVFFIEFLLLDVICGNYATNPFKFFAWIVTIISGFALFQFFAFNMNNLDLVVNLPTDSNSLLISLLISVSNFFQIDLFEHIESFGLYIISLIEKIIGVILLAIFTVSYTRKVIK